MKFKGRLILLENIADGADPATHAILGLYWVVSLDGRRRGVREGDRQRS